MVECSECGKQCKSVYALNSHSRVHKPGYVNKGYAAGAGAFQRNAALARNKQYDLEPVTCNHCNAPLTYEQHKEGNQFCRRSCAASFNNKKRVVNLALNRICKHCGGAFRGSRSRSFCTTKHRKEYQILHPRVITEEGREKMRRGGQRAIEVQGDARRSTNEILFYNLCAKEFKNVTNNERAFNGWDADVILHDAKVAVLWNGRWHYVKITKKHSVEQVQNRDKIKIAEILKAGYTPYVIQDLGRSGVNANELFVHEQFAEFVKWMRAGVTLSLPTDL